MCLPSWGGRGDAAVVRLVGLAVVAGALGCGRIAFDPRGDTDIDASVGPDLTCWPAWRGDVMLEAPVAVDDVNTAANEKNPFLSRDGLTLYFASDRPGSSGIDFWQAKRPTVAAPFVVDSPVLGVNSATDEGRLELTDDELTAVFSSVRTGSIGNDLYLGTRATTSASFALDAAAMANLNSADGDKDPHLIAGTTRLYYSVGETAIKVSDRAGTVYAAPQTLEVPPPPGATTVADPQPSPDELTLLFSAGDVGALDFYVATRNTVAETFGSPRSLPILNTANLERDLFVTADGCEVWFSRQLTNDEIYRSRVIQ